MNWMYELLTADAQSEYHHWKATGEIDPTQNLFNEVYELIANEMDPDEREDDDMLYDAVMDAIKNI